MTRVSSRQRTRTATWVLAVVVAVGLAGGVEASADPGTTGPRWQLDESFGDDGVVRTDFPVARDSFDQAWGYDHLVQPDGRIVVTGFVSLWKPFVDYAGIVRYLPNGQRDPSFGEDGRVTLGPHALYWATNVALQRSNGQDKLIVAMQTTYKHPYRYRCSVARLNPDGSLDTDHDADPGTAFGSGGIKIIEFPNNSGFCEGLAVQPNGRIVVSVRVTRGNGPGGDIGVARLLAGNGHFDPTFGVGGQVTLRTDGYEDAGPVTLQPVAGGGQPRIVVGGDICHRQNCPGALWRFTPSGKLDTTFGTEGRVVTHQFSYGIWGLAVTDAGRIVASGSHWINPGGQRPPEDTAAVARYLRDGTLDSTFGGDGFVHTPYDARGGATAADIALGEDGSIVWAGWLSEPTSDNVLVGGYLSDGSLDRRFGSDGVIWMHFWSSNHYDEANSVAFDPQGRVTIAGIAADPDDVRGADRFGLARLRLAG